MNIKRYLLSVLALFLFVSVYEMFVHGYMLMDMYEAAAHVWRNFDEMKANMPLEFCFQLASSAWVAFIFTQFYKNGGIINGLIFGLYFGVFAGILTATWYLWIPIPATLSLSWFISSVIEGLGGGAILGLVYRK